MDNKINLETLLPCGEKLKPLLNKSCISDSDIKDLLNKRGVYMSKSTKRNYIPMLTMSILSPMEFEELQEKQKTKEDSIKYRTLKIKSNIENDLFEAIPLDLIDPGKLTNSTSSFELNTDVNFSIEDPNKLTLDYGLLRDDITKDWVDSKSIHTGRIIIEKNNSNKMITFKSEFTSTETYNVNDEIVKYVKKQLVSQGYIDTSSEMISIKSDSFDNRERFKFMLQLANDSENGLLKFNAVRNIEIGPDENAKLPDEAKWMADSVKNMIINGEKLQDIEFIKNPQYHDSLILREIKAQYTFKTSIAEGTCIIEYGFPTYFRKNSKDKNFQASISRVYFWKNSNTNNLTNISRILLNEFEEMKDLVYEKIKSNKQI